MNINSNLAGKTDRKFTKKDLWVGLKAVFRNAMEFKRIFITASVLSVVYAIINPLDTLLLGRFIDSLTQYIPGANVTSKTFTILGYDLPLYFGILFLWTCSVIAELILGKYRVLNSLKLNEFVRTSYITKLAGHLFRLPMNFHKTNKMGEVQEKVSMAAGSMGNILGEDLIIFLPQFISTLIILVVIYTLNIYLFVFVLLVIAVSIYTTATIIRPMIPLQRENQRIYARVRGNVIDAIMNIKIVKDFVAEKYQTDFARNSYQNQAIPVWYKLMQLRRNLIIAQDSIVLVARVVVFVFSIYLLNKGLWTIGSLVIANSYLNQIFAPIRGLANSWRNIQNGIIAIEDTEAILALPTEKYEPQAAKDEPYLGKELRGKVEFKNVSFSYAAGKTILNNVSFTANPGEVIAIVGESGVGKSSLIDLISAYDFAREGDILIDDVSIRDITLTKLRHNIGVVTQELTLFNDTIINNIRYGNFERTDEEVFAACRKAHCFDFIEKFPEKWQQVVGERGLKLSVGQKQRVAIARAILKNPRILILDEPTSALDAGSEKIITESLDELMKGKTTFIVAHRLSTVRRADTILVFKDGQITESGKHGDLMAKEGGEYRRLYELQVGLHE